MSVMSVRNIIAAILFSSLGAISAGASDGMPTIVSSREAAALTDAEFAKGRPFDITATVVAVYKDGIIFLKDSDGFFRVVPNGEVKLGPKDTARIRGYTKYKKDSSEVRDLVATSAVVVGTSELPKPRSVSVAEILRQPEDSDYVRVRGKITDAFIDEIDSNWNYMILKDGANVISVALANAGDIRSRMAGFVDAEVELTGGAFSGHAGFRIFLGPFLQLWDESCIRIVKPAPKDPFSLPGVGTIGEATPRMIAAMGRRTASGYVLAVWGSGKVLLREDTGRIVGVDLSNATEQPSAGDRISVVGYPETDLYRINLSRAQFRREASGTATVDVPTEVSPEHILFDSRGRQMIKPNFHGKLVTMTGLVRALPAEAGEERLIHLECDKILVPVDVSARPEISAGLEIGSRLAVTGTCVLESPSWRPSMVFPHIDRLVLVPRSKEDIVVLARPPWWTPARLLAFIGALLAALVVILIWNFALRRLAERRGRELYRAEISKASAELRIDERTRLAAELHDAIAQNLTGVSLQIATARQAKTTDPDAEEHHLATAEQMLRSSRVELRRCIWDLRSEALDVPDFSEAIRRTVQPVTGNAALKVECSIPRKKLSDSTAHALLQIVRELASNAATHGKAGKIDIHGQEADGTARLSVRDNGTGFDPEHCPGQNEGHFGIKGIRERVKRLDGTFVISSTPGEGTTATIEIRMN